MERKLASVQKILEIKPIEGADRIVEVRVLGWNLVALADEFQVGDLCVYFEIDSILPDVSCFEFVKRGSEKVSKLRLKTMKLRGIISQGLAFPFYKTENDFELPNKLEVGDDLTELLKVNKWEPKEPGAKQDSIPKGNFPHYVPKTDETRIQSIPTLLEELQGVEVYATVKLDGCSASFMSYEGEYSVCSRNLALKSMEEKWIALREREAQGKEVHPPRIDRWWEMSKKLGLEEKLKAKGNYAIQGELCGPGIQKNRLKLAENELFIFNVYDIDARQLLDYKDLKVFVAELGLKMVPVDSEFTIGPEHTVAHLLKMAEGKYESGQHREGIVIRPIKRVYSKVLRGRTSFKVISNKFLLKGGN